MVYYKENKLLIDLAISERQSCFESFTNNWLNATDDSKLIGTVLLDVGKVLKFCIKNIQIPC